MSEKVWVLRINFCNKLVCWGRKRGQMLKKQKKDSKIREIGTYLSQEKLSEVRREINEANSTW